MKVHSATFQTSSPDLRSCPESDLQEFAFIGRSNVGKSSLINLLTNKSTLAKVSSTPGRTELINFFLINNKWCLVDLPGYGYAKTANRDKFQGMIVDYLTKRSNLSLVFVLIDGRHPPQVIDLEFLHWLMSKNVPCVLVFTKADKLSAAALQANIDLFKQAMSEWCETEPLIFKSSIKTKAGQIDMLREIGKCLS